MQNESFLRKAGVSHKGTIWVKAALMLASADNIDIITRVKRDVTTAFSSIERESVDMSLAIETE